jgi:hypothetical protein
MARRGVVFIGIGGIGAEALVCLKKLHGGLAPVGDAGHAPRYLHIDSTEFPAEQGAGTGTSLGRNESLVLRIDQKS